MQGKKHIQILKEETTLLWCSSLAALLSKEEFFIVDIVDELPSVLARTTPADLIIFMAWRAGLASTVQHARRTCCGKLLLIVDNETNLTVGQLIRLGFEGAVSSQSSYSELLDAIQTLVNRRLKYISPLLLTALAETQEPEPWSSLSPKELDVALSMTKGMRNIDIALGMKVSPKTVSSYKRRIFKKLRISNCAQLFKLCLSAHVSCEQVGARLNEQPEMGISDP